MQRVAAGCSLCQALNVGMAWEKVRRLEPIRF